MISSYFGWASHQSFFFPSQLQPGASLGQLQPGLGLTILPKGNPPLTHLDTRATHSHSGDAAAAYPSGNPAWAIPRTQTGCQCNVFVRSCNLAPPGTALGIGTLRLANAEPMMPIRLHTWHISKRVYYSCAPPTGITATAWARHADFSAGMGGTRGGRVWFLPSRRCIMVELAAMALQAAWAVYPSPRSRYDVGNVSIRYSPSPVPALRFISTLHQ